MGKDFHNDFFGEIFVKIFVVCEGLNLICLYGTCKVLRSMLENRPAVFEKHKKHNDIFEKFSKLNNSTKGTGILPCQINFLSLGYHLLYFVSCCEINFHQSSSQSLSVIEAISVD